MLGHKASLGKFKKIEIISSIFSYHSVRLQINYKEKHKSQTLGGKQYAIKQSMDHWRNQKGNLKIPTDKWKWKHDNPKPMGCSKSSLRAKFLTIQSYLRKQEKFQIT